MPSKVTVAKLNAILKKLNVSFKGKKEEMRNMILWKLAEQQYENTVRGEKYDANEKQYVVRSENDASDVPELKIFAVGENDVPLIDKDDLFVPDNQQHDASYFVGYAIDQGIKISGLQHWKGTTRKWWDSSVSTKAKQRMFT